MSLSPLLPDMVLGDGVAAGEALLDPQSLSKLGLAIC